MISSKKLIRLARKWHKIASIGSKRISVPRSHEDVNNTSNVAEKGHFVIYTSDQRRFVIPLAYLYTNIFQELFKMSEEEFGISSEGPITLPCDAVFMNYVVLLIQRGAVKDLEKALVNSIATSSCLLASSLHQEHTSKQFLVCGY
jgi:hypothetical protein|uniref:Auxin-responsive protein n=1 Tax=Fagus sylvatica TaxID=28930 RepID=A0A2N9ETY6_FAGSY